MSKPNPVDVRVGGRLRNTRKFRGITLNALASALKISARRLSRIERGEDRFSAELMYIASRILNVRATFFFKDPINDEKAHAERSPDSAVTSLDRYRAAAGRSSASNRPMTTCVVLPFGEPGADTFVRAFRRA